MFLNLMVLHVLKSLRTPVLLHLHQNTHMLYTILTQACLRCHARPEPAVFLCCQLCPECVCSIWVARPCKPARSSSPSKGDWLRLIKTHTYTAKHVHATARINNSQTEVRFWASYNELKASRGDLNKLVRALHQKGPALARMVRDSKCLSHRVSHAKHGYLQRNGPNSYVKIQLGSTAAKVRQVRSQPHHQELIKDPAVQYPLWWQFGLVWNPSQRWNGSLMNETF